MRKALNPSFWTATLAWVIGSGCGGPPIVRVDVEAFRFTVQGQEAQARSGLGVSDQDLVIADARVVRRGNGMKAAFQDERQVEACDLRALDNKVGVAVLQARGQPGKTLTFVMADEVAVDEAVYVPSRDHARDNRDVVFVDQVIGGSDPTILLRGPLDGTRGPVFDAFGRFVGLLRDTFIVGGSPVGVVIPAWRIRPVVDRVREKRPVPLPVVQFDFKRLGASLVKVQQRLLCPERGETIAFSLELANDQDYFVTVTEPGAGYTLEVGGQPVRPSASETVTDSARRNGPDDEWSPFHECRLGRAACFTITATDVPVTGTLRADSDVTGCAMLEVRRISWTPW
jgi:hypothetical protein